MPISFSEKNKTFHLDTEHTSCVMQIGPSGELRHLYYGASIASGDDLSSFARRRDRAFSPYPESLTANESLNIANLEISSFGSGDFHNTAIRLQKQNGSSVTSTVYSSHTIRKGKAPLPGLPASFAPEKQCETLEVVMKDSFSDVRIVLRYSVFENSDVIARSVTIVNPGPEPVRIEKLMSAQLDFESSEYDMVYLQGKWARERHAVRVPVHPGMQGFRSARGSTGHQYNPGIVLASRSASERTGEVFGMLLLYSGSYAVEVESDEYQALRAMIGINDETFCWRLEPGAEFHSPETLLVFSENGLGGLSRQYHSFLMEHVIRSPWKHVRRPILVNNWEATYFEFDDRKIYELARSAASLGIEMLVLDDGWFGKRNDDRSSLGDWFVNTRKLGNLGKLVEKINRLGMKFGLWFEPEMISEDSDLYRKHPEWVLSVPGKRRSLGRSQMVLDMSRKEVVDYLFETIAGILHSANIEYIKWDMNRNLTEIYSASLPAEQQGEVAHRYVLGVYELHERLLNEFPNLLIEGCSGGGGRFDAGMLYYVPQIWCSDDTDALERIPIQLGTSLFYPSSTMGAHVSVCPNHQTHRTVSFRLRGDVALAGTFGYELDITALGEDEQKQIREQIGRYHQFNDLIREGNFYRVTENFGLDDVSAWCWVSADRKEVLMTAVRSSDSPCAQSPVVRLRIPGLDPGLIYRMQDRPFAMHGSTLMNAGINASEDLRGNAVSVLYHLKAE